MSLKENIDKWLVSKNILDAITVIYQYKQQKKRVSFQRRIFDIGFLITLGALSLKYLLLCFQRKKIEQKLNQTYIQYPLSSKQLQPSILILLDNHLMYITEQLQNQDYLDIYEVMRDQFQFLNQDTILAKNIYLSGLVDRQITLGTCLPKIYSNDLLNLQLFQYMFKLKFNQQAQFNLFDDDFKYKSIVDLKNQLIKPKQTLTNLQQIKNRKKFTYLQEPKEVQNKIDIYFALNQVLGVFSMKNLIQGIKMKCDLQEIVIKPNSPLCILGDCIINIQEKSVRITNIKRFGQTFTQLIQSLRNHYNHHLIRNQKLKNFCFNLVLIISVWYLSNKIKKKIQFSYITCIENEYPGISQIKTKFKAAYIDSKILSKNNYLDCCNCLTLKKEVINKKEVIMIPCYHLQYCKECFKNMEKVTCLSCNERVYSGIEIFLN